MQISSPTPTIEFSESVHNPTLTAELVGSLDKEMKSYATSLFIILSLR